jgi:hypothetical protein
LKGLNGKTCAKAFAGNESGWTGQLRNIASYLTANP